MDKAKVQSIIKKLGLSWKKWNDEAVKKEEKASIKATMEKLLDKYNLDIDWKTGKVTAKNASKQDDSKQKTTAGGSTGKKSTKQGMSTADLIKHIFETYGDEWTGKNLRRKIRQMDKWNDGKMTHYDFTPADINEILTHLGYKKAGKAS